MTTDRKTILNTLIAQLQTLTLANGYSVEAKKVGKIFKSEVTFSNGFFYPNIAYVLIDTGDAQIVRFEDIEFVRKNLNFEITAWIATEADNDETGVLSDAMDTALKEIVRCLCNIDQASAQAITLVSESRSVPDGKNVGSVSVIGTFEFTESYTT